MSLQVTLVPFRINSEEMLSFHLGYFFTKSQLITPCGTWAVNLNRLTSLEVQCLTETCVLFPILYNT